MSIEIAKSFIKATTEVLGTMARITPVAGKPYVKKNTVARGDVSGVIGLTGDKVGTISVTFTQSCILGILRNMLGEDIENVIKDTQDAVGELTNMISGKSRQLLSETGLTIHAATPTVILGKGHTIYHISKEPIMAIPFTTDHGEFTVEFCF